MENPMKITERFEFQNIFQKEMLVFSKRFTVI